MPGQLADILPLCNGRTGAALAVLQLLQYFSHSWKSTGKHELTLSGLKYKISPKAKEVAETVALASGSTGEQTQETIDGSR